MGNASKTKKVKNVRKERNFNLDLICLIKVANNP